jgi:DNA polymerase III alpha subunit (gram-positive type)
MFVEYVCDTETTGTEPGRNDVIEICFWKIGAEESRTWQLKPLRPEEIEEKALLVNKHKKEDILWQTDFGKKTYRLPEEVLPEIEMYFMEDGAAPEDRVFIGHNPMFDYNFLVALWKDMKQEDNFPFGDWRAVKEGRINNTIIHDTLEMVKRIDTMIGRKRQRYNLGSLVKDFGITKATAHRADGDVRMTKDLYFKITEPFKELAKNHFGEDENSSGA